MFCDRELMGLRPTQRDKNGFHWLVFLSVPNRIVIPTVAKRRDPFDFASGQALLFHTALSECVFDRGVMGLFGPPKGMKNGKQNCHPDRSEAKWRDLLF
jgi:hypothetical protein